MRAEGGGSGTTAQTQLIFWCRTDSAKHFLQGENRGFLHGKSTTHSLSLLITNSLTHSLGLPFSPMGLSLSSFCVSILQQFSLLLLLFGFSRHTHSLNSGFSSPASWQRFRKPPRYVKSTSTVEENKWNFNNGVVVGYFHCTRHCGMLAAAVLLLCMSLLLQSEERRSIPAPRICTTLLHGCLTLRPRHNGADCTASRRPIQWAFSEPRLLCDTWKTVQRQR